MNKTTTVYLVRHAESEWNVERKVQGYGIGDSELTQNGKKGALRFAKSMSQVHFDAIITSPSLRAKETAEIIAKDRKLHIETNPDLHERPFGKYEGTSMKDFISKYKNWDSLTMEEKMNYKVDENEESQNEAYTRVSKALFKIAKENPGETVLCVTHGGLIRIILIKAGLGDFDTIGGIKNCGFAKLTIADNKIKIDKVEGIKTWAETNWKKAS